MTSKNKWSYLKSGRTEATKNLPLILSLPLINSYRELLIDHVEEGMSLLDVGANDRRLYNYITEKTHKKIIYESYDIDNSLFHDYYNIDEIKKKFDIITMFEVVEHMEIDEIKKVFCKVRDILNDGGLFFVSTPNVYHPVRFWRDSSHITPFAYDELVGLLISANFSDFRVYRIKKNMKFKDLFRYWLYKPLIKLLGIDFAPGIVVIGKAGLNG